MRLLLALASPTVALAVAATAHADPTDDGFLVSLREAGLTYQTPESAIAAGRSVCRIAGGGKAMADVVKDVQNANPALDQDNAAKFTAIAANAYCPNAIRVAPVGN